MMVWGEQEYAVLTRLDKQSRWTAMVVGDEEDRAVMLSGEPHGDLDGAMMSLLRGTSRRVAEMFERGSGGAGPSGSKAPETGAKR